MGDNAFAGFLISGISIALAGSLLCYKAVAAAPYAPAPIKPPSYEEQRIGETAKPVFEEEAEGEEEANRALPMPPPPHKSAAWVLEQMSQAENPYIRNRAAEAWPMESPEIEKVEVLIEQLCDPSAAVRASAEKQLATLSPASLFSYVMRTYTGLDTFKTQRLECALPTLPPEVGPYFVDTLDTEIELPLHRRIAAYVLGRMKYRNGIDVLTRHVWHMDTTLSYGCVEALYAMNDPQSLSLWIQLLGHENAHIRPLAVQGLALLQSPGAVEQIRRLVLTPGNSVAQVNALAATESYPVEWQFPLLVDVMEHNTALAAQAHRLLRKRSGMNLSPNPATWRNWLNSLFNPPVSPLVPAE